MVGYAFPEMLVLRNWSDHRVEMYMLNSYYNAVKI